MKPITMSYEEYNKMMDFCKQFVSNKSTSYKREILQYINLTYNNNTAVAEAVEGYKAGRISLLINNCESEETMILPVTGKLKKSDVFAVITEKSNNEVEIRTVSGAMLYKIPEDEFVNTSNLYPKEEPSEKIAFNASLLSTALKAFGDDVVEIEYRGSKKPIVIKSSTGQALVAPVNR